jgi:peptidyl-prolyl cis-trans isomerase B (cyclophilin B)
VPSNQQRREAAKRKLQRQMVRREQRARAQRRRLVIAGAIAAVLVIAGGVWLFASVGSGGNGTSSQTTTSGSATSSTAPTTPCTFTSSGKAARDVKPPTNLSPANTGTVEATVTFAGGPVTVQLDRKNAPCAVESFVSLASQKFFDGTTCHRLTDADTLRILQCGDPTGTGTGGPGYTFADELAGSEKYTTGVVAMANSGTDTNGSQFFFVWGDSTALSPDYTVLGKVTQGMDVIDTIAKAGITGGAQEGKPKGDAAITTVTVPADAAEATGNYSTSASPTATGSGATGAATTGTGASDTAATGSGTGSPTAAATSPAATTSSPAGTTASS